MRAQFTLDLFAIAKFLVRKLMTVVVRARLTTRGRQTFCLINTTLVVGCRDGKQSSTASLKTVYGPKSLTVSVLVLVSSLKIKTVSRHYLTLNISEMVPDTDVVAVEHAANSGVSFRMTLSEFE